MTATREELARLILAHASDHSVVLADRILALYDLVPKGSIVVPAEPTEEMLTAPVGEYIHLGRPVPAEDWDAPELKKVRAMIYRAMLAARPGASHE